MLHFAIYTFLMPEKNNILGSVVDIFHCGCSLNIHNWSNVATKYVISYDNTYSTVGFLLKEEVGRILDTYDHCAGVHGHRSRYVV